MRVAPPISGLTPYTKDLAMTAVLPMPTGDRPQTLYGINNLEKLATATTIAFDCETVGLQPERGKLRLLQLAARGLPAVIIDCWDLDDSGWDKLAEFFARVEGRTWIAHNAVFDLGWLQEHEVYPKGILLCTMLASKLLNNGIPNLKHGLAAVSQRYLKRELSKEQQLSDWSAPVLSASQLEYAAEDVYVLLELDPVFTTYMRTGSLSNAWACECRALPAMAQMWRTGLPFNREKLLALQVELESSIENYGNKFLVQLDEALPEEHKLPREPDGSFNLRTKDSGSVRAGTKVYAGFNLNSSKQLVAKLTLLLGQIPTDKDGKPSASRQALRSYAADHAVVQIYLSWKRAEKRRQMVVSLLEHQAPDGFIRASYLQLGAESGRMSCMKPNLQQCPRDSNFRECAEAPEGWTFVCADFGQMELRLAAAIAGDARMIKAFQDGEDLHTITAEAIYPDHTDDEAELKKRRQVAKSANFGLLFGSGANGLREYAGSMGITMTKDEAEIIRNTFRSTYAGIAEWQEQSARQAFQSRTNKWAQVRVPHNNMRRYLMGDMNRLTTRCNTPVQGAGAAILKRALGQLWPHLFEAGEDEVRLAAVVHDECLLLVREGKEEHWKTRLSQVMEAAEAEWLGDIPPLAEANSGKTWNTAK